MNEDFVPYELAVKLNEKGFNYETRDIYERNILACRYEDVPKPTISQVLKWLREERKVVVSMNPYYGKFVNVHWWWDIRTPVYKVEICNNIKQEGFDSYELAALAGIEYVIDNLI